MRLPFLLLTIATLTCNHPLFSAEKDEKLLQGKWIGTEAGSTDEDVVEVEIDGKEMHFTNNKTGEWYKGKFVINDAENPKQLVLTIADCPIREMIGKDGNAIYELSDESLTVAARRPGDPSFPKDFRDKESRVFTLKKVKPKRQSTNFATI